MIQEWKQVKRIFKFNFQNNKTKVRCSASCCKNTHAIKSTLNGNNGEATNTDDLKRQDAQQNKRIAQLERKLRSVTLQKAKKSKNGAKKRNRNSLPKTFARSPFPGIADVNSFDSQPAVVHRDPTVLSCVAQLAPFRIPRGVANLLHDCKPSQKFTARCLFSISPAASSESLVVLCPCIASDSGGHSLVSFTGTRANLTLQMVSGTSLVAGVTYNASTTNTPYTSATLGGGDYKWRLVSAGYRVRNTTAAVNRQGVLKWNIDHDTVLYDWGNFAVSNYGDAADAIDSSHRTVRRNMSTHPESDIVLSGQLYAEDEGQNYWRGAAAGEAYNTTLSFYPTCTIGPQVVNPGTNAHGLAGGIILLPAVSIAQSYDIEVIEHWEITGSAIETLHTPSGSHAMAADTLSSIIKQGHHQHAMTPSMALHDVCKGISFAEHHKAAIKDAASVATAIALL